MSGYVSRFRSIVTGLQEVAGEAVATKARLDDAHTAALSYQETTRQVVKGQEEAQAHIARTISSMSSAASSVKDSATSISSSSSAAASASRAAAQAVEENGKRISDSAASAHNQAKLKLDELEYLVKQSGNIWDTQIIELIESIKVGAAPVELLISQFGDAMVQGERLTEFLRGANLKGYQNDLRELILDLHNGQAEVSDALAVLGESQLAVAKKFKEVIELYRAGKVSLQFVLEQAERIRKAMPDSDFADLTGAIEDALRRGDGT